MAARNNPRAFGWQHGIISPEQRLRNTIKSQQELRQKQGATGKPDPMSALGINLERLREGVDETEIDKINAMLFAMQKLKMEQEILQNWGSLEPGLQQRMPADVKMKAMSMGGAVRSETGVRPQEACGNLSPPCTATETIGIRWTGESSMGRKVSGQGRLLIPEKLIQPDQSSTPWKKMVKPMLAGDFIPNQKISGQQFQMYLHEKGDWWLNIDGNTTWLNIYEA